MDTIKWHVLYPLLHRYIGARDRLRFCQLNSALRLFRKWRPKLHVKAEEGSQLPPGVTHLELCITRGAFYEIELDCVTHLTITIKDYCYVKSIIDIVLPTRLRFLHFGGGFDCKVYETVGGKHRSIRFPDTIEELVFGDEFNQRLTFLEFPKKLKRLQIGDKFGWSIQKCALPDSLESLILGEKWSEDPRLPRGGIWTLPNGLKQLVMNGFRHKVVFKQSPGYWKLPAGLKTLFIGHQFGHSIAGWVLPKALEWLTIMHCAGSHIPDDTFPNTLRYLRINGIESPLPQPPSLEELRIDIYRAEFGFPKHSRLRTLQTGIISGLPSEGLFRFPSTLVKLVVSTFWRCDALRYVVMPECLEELDLSKTRFNAPVIGWSLPRHLKVLRLGIIFNQPVINEQGQLGLPSSLEILCMGNVFNQPTIGWTLPDKIRVLRMGDSFDQPVLGWNLPCSLKRLFFPVTKPDQIECWNLPKGLEVLYAVVNYTNVINLPVLPPGLKSLSLVGAFNGKVTLPGSLHTLELGNAFQQPLTFSMPDSLRVIIIRSDYGASLKGVRFPPNLERLTFPNGVNLARLKEIELPVDTVVKVFDKPIYKGNVLVYNF